MSNDYKRLSSGLELYALLPFEYHCPPHRPGGSLSIGGVIENLLDPCFVSQIAKKYTRMLTLAEVLLEPSP